MTWVRYRIPVVLSLFVTTKRCLQIKIATLDVTLNAYAYLLMRFNLIAGFYGLVISHFSREARA